MAILLESAIRATLIAAAFGMLIEILRLRSPGARHALWAALVVVMIFLPAVTKWGPRVPIRVLPPQLRLEQVNPIAPTAKRPEQGTLTDTLPPVRAGRLPMSTWSGWLFVVYWLGVLVFTARLVVGSWQACRFARTATLVGGRLTSAICATPVTTGIFAPVVILPTRWLTWPRNGLEAILAHEREHVRRRDPLFQFLALLNRTVFWFHPLAWWLRWKIAALAEEACDAAVLARGNDPIAYSEALLECAQAAMSAGGRLHAVGMSMRGTRLPQRIERILSGVHHDPTSRQRLVLAALTSIAAATMLVAAVPAQTLPDPAAFEVASVKRNTAGGGIILFPTPGTLRMVNHPLSALIATAHEVPEDQVIGPDWIREARFDVIAKTSSDQVPVFAGPDSVRPMLRTLLEERFHLAVHHETRSFPKYALVVVRKDGTLGPRLQRSSIDCAPLIADRRAQPRIAGSISMPALGSPCTMLNYSGTSTVADSVPIRQLVSYLTGRVDRGIIDRTGLDGLFSFTLDVEPAVSIFTLIQEQLGLKLEPTMAPSDVVIIDRVEPSIED
jgi:uncharacterized protein (TIGR03435 family)